MWEHYPDPMWQPEEERHRRQAGEGRGRQGLLRNLIGWLIAYGLLVAGLVVVAWLLGQQG